MTPVEDRLDRKEPRRPDDAGTWGVGGRLAMGLMEILVAVLVVYAIDELAHQPLSVRGFVMAVLTWLLWAPAAWWLRRRASWWQAGLGQIAGPGLFFVVLRPFSPAGLTWGQEGFGLLAVAAISTGARAWVQAARNGGAVVAAECARLVLVAGVGVAAMAGFLTDRFVGGVDARWYMYMLADFIQQLREGVFPVLVGQGELAYNGAVHPFRSAPLLFHVSGLLDLLTGRSLGPVSLQHLTTIVLSVAGAAGTYGFLAALAPARRGLAAAVAVIYVTSPAFMTAAYGKEQLMMFTTVATLPIVVFGLLRIAQTDGLLGWRWLAAGLALVWMGHAGTAFFCSGAVAVIMGGRFLFGRTTPAQRRAAAAGLGWFLILGCYYFISMSELPKVSGLPVWPSVVQTLGAAALLVGMVRGLIWNQRWGWGAWLAGLALLGWIAPAWFWAGTMASILAGIVAGLARWRRWFEPETYGLVLAAGSLLAAGWIASGIVMARYPVVNVQSLVLLQNYTDTFVTYFDPIVRGIDDFHLGVGVMALVGVMVWVAVVGRQLQTGLMVVAILVLAGSCLPVPALSRFWVAYFPEAFTEITQFPLNFRIFPTVIALACGGGFVVLPPRRGKVPATMVALVFTLAAWSACQIPAALRDIAGRTNSRAGTLDRLRSENSMLDRYAYDMLPLPSYFTNGKSDYRLESRIFDDHSRLVIGPLQIAAEMEKAGAERILLTSTVEITGPTWLNLHPELTLAPGDHVLLRFEFPDKIYDGFLILRSEHGYREYRLPESGGFKAFGVPRGRAKVLSLWNSGTTIEHVKLQFSRGGSNATGEFGDFARMTVSRFVPEKSPIRVRGLIPYRAEVDLPGPGWLETPRIFIPGYAAMVDGRPANIRSSIDSQVAIAVPAGRHEVVLKFAGSSRLWLGWWISALGWVGLVAVMFRRRVAVSLAPPPALSHE